MMEFDVQSISCGHCVSTVTKALKAADPAAKVDVDLANHKVRVDSAKDRTAIAKVLAEAGYPAT